MYAYILHIHIHRPYTYTHAKCIGHLGFSFELLKAKTQPKHKGL